MLDELKEEGIVNKVGGRFKLSTLIQKRMVALNTGARPLVDSRSGDKLTIVISEILQDKIFLDASGNLQTRAPVNGDPARRAMMSRRLRRRRRRRLARCDACVDGFVMGFSPRVWTEIYITNPRSMYDIALMERVVRVPGKDAGTGFRTVLPTHPLACETAPWLNRLHFPNRVKSTMWVTSGSAVSPLLAWSWAYCLCCSCLIQVLLGLLSHSTVLLPLWLEFFAALGVCLSLIGIRTIRNSDGTLAGLKIAKVGLWLSLGFRPGVRFLLWRHLSRRQATGRHLCSELVRHGAQGEDQPGVPYDQAGGARTHGKPGR